jgi:hypothetical protein
MTNDLDEIYDFFNKLVFEIYTLKDIDNKQELCSIRGNILDFLQHCPKGNEKSNHGTI